MPGGLFLMLFWDRFNNFHFDVTGCLESYKSENCAGKPANVLTKHDLLFELLQ